MFEIVTELLLHRQIKFEKGKIEMFGRPTSLLPTDSFVNILKELEKMNKENVIYFAGKKSGELWFKDMGRAFKLGRKDVIKWGSDIVTLAGWGEAIITERDDKKKLIVFNLRDSITVKLYGPSKYAVDHFFRGLLCGAMCFVYGTNMEAVETKCRAKGDSICEVVVKPKKRFDFSDPLVKRQLSIPK